MTNQKKLVWVSVASLALIAVMAVYFHSNALAVAGSGNKTPVTTTHSMEAASVEVDQPRVKDIEVGTEWYDPNEKMLRLSIEGYPTARNVRWRVRANYDDGKIVHMEPINSSTPRDVVFTNGVKAVEYSIEPGQGIDHCTFRFKFGHWQ